MYPNVVGGGGRGIASNTSTVFEIIIIKSALINLYCSIHYSQLGEKKVIFAACYWAYCVYKFTS